MAPIIHPIWVIDENAMIPRIRVWFIPMIPPVRALIMAAIEVRIEEVLLFIVQASRTRGATFCQVIKIKQFIQVINIVTLGNQK